MSDAITGKIRVLALDDDPSVTWILSDGLNNDNFEVLTCNDSRTALQKLVQFHPDVCLLDLKMPGMDGIEVLGHIKRFDPTISVIIVSGHADTPLVVRAIQAGAEDFIVKPFEVEMVGLCINKVLEKKDLKQRVKRLEQELAKQTARQDFIGESPQVVRLRELIEQVGTTDLNVLLRGETGTGKDVVARTIHLLSDRSRGPFVKVNCAALPAELLESELFGHERGAFTGAYKSKPGRFELADKGTIFLDEIGEMPIQLQATLLQVLEHREFFRVGGTTTVKVNVRLITATNIDIEKHIQEGKFRLDLLYRLNDITVNLPPLRERGDDIIVLAQHFLERYCEKLNKTSWQLSPRSEHTLLRYPWPGNVRELESLMKRASIFGESEIEKHVERHQNDAMVIQSEAMMRSGAPMQMLNDIYFQGKTLREVNDDVIAQIERRAIELSLERHGWNRKRAAKELAISYRCLLYKIQEYALKPDQSDPDNEPQETYLASGTDD